MVKRIKKEESIETLMSQLKDMPFEKPSNLNDKEFIERCYDTRASLSRILATTMRLG